MKRRGANKRAVGTLLGIGADDGSPGRATSYTDPRDLAMFFAALSCGAVTFFGEITSITERP